MFRGLCNKVEFVECGLAPEMRRRFEKHTLPFWSSAGMELQPIRLWLNLGQRAGVIPLLICRDKDPEVALNKIPGSRIWTLVVSCR